MRYFLLLTLLFPLTAKAQLRIDSIRITQESVPFIGSNTPNGVDSWSTTIVPITDTIIFDEANGIIHYSAMEGMTSVSFAYDSTSQTVHSFTMTSGSGHPDDIQGYSGINWGFLRDTLLLDGIDFRIHLSSEELKPDNFGFSTMNKERLGAGQYKESSTYSTLPTANSWVEVIFFGSVPLDVAVPERSSFAVYPNPASQTITIAGLSESETIRIFDLAGREYEIRSSFTGSEHLLDIRSLENGLYVVRVGTFTQKLIVIR